MLFRLFKKKIPSRVKNYIKTLLRVYRKFTSGHWAKKQVTDMTSFCNAIDPVVWQEAQKFSLALNKTGRDLLNKSEIWQGGPGALPLLYFVVRKTRPNFIIETGVASGWSSSSILAALRSNNNGLLYSSELPYPNIKGSHEVVGLVVEDNLKTRWKLYLEGDEISLPIILSEVGNVDLFHYDSRKSIKGREFAWKLIKKSLSRNAILIFDDIQDNYHFKNLVESINCDYIIFEYMGKYLGVFTIGNSIKEVLKSHRYN